MLAAFIRCAFLIGILGWYSINVWKMIDGYFRDQFANYLHEEYRKNPHMKSDVKNINGNDKKENHVIDGNVLIQKLEELQQQESCSIDKVDSDLNVESCESAEISKLIDRPNESVEKKETLEIIVTEKEDSNDEQMSIKKGPDKMVESLEKPKKKKLISKKEEEEMEEKDKSKKDKKKKRIKTIILKEEDFISVKKRQRGTIGRDEDFWEFEEDKEEGGREREEVKGIRVADLSFKPKLDIGRLERITPDEYCPLTLEDELSCEETTEWSLK